MGWYFRKSFGFGPFRLNLSKSGIGYSFGVRGARIGTGPRGNYIRLGRDGVYYQKYSGARGIPIANPPGNIRTPPPQPEVSEPVTKPEPSHLEDASANELLREIREKRSKANLAPAFAVISLVALLLTFGVSPEPVRASVLALVAFIVWLQLRQADRSRKIVHLSYQLDHDAQRRYDSLLASVASLGSCAAVWRVVSQQVNQSLKHNAGAFYSVQRTRLKYVDAPPKGMQINVAVAQLNLDNPVLLFVPDRLLIFAGNDVGAVEYPGLSCELKPMRFVEGEAVPPDARVVDSTWMYRNKDGGPDRRFANNRQLPIVQYAEIDLRSTTGMHFILHASSLDKARLFADGICHCAGRSAAERAEAEKETLHSNPSEAEGPSEDGAPGGGQPARIHRVLEALKSGNLHLLRANAPIPLEPEEVCHISVEDCVYLAGAYSSNPNPHIGNLYLTNERFRYVGENLSVELMMKKIYLSLLNPEVPTWITATMKTALHCTHDPGVVQVVSGTDPTIFHLAGRTPLVNELIAVAIRKISAAAKQRANERKHTSSRQTGKTVGERSGKDPTQSPWEILCVSPSASADEVAAAYRKIAQQYHPDKVATMGPEIREVAERKMKEINAAYDEIRSAGR